MQIRAACPTLPDTRQLSRSGVRTAARVAALFLFPINTNNQNVRTRYWNGHDYMYRDDLTWIKGNHLFQLGGMIGCRITHEIEISPSPYMMTLGGQSFANAWKDVMVARTSTNVPSRKLKRGAPNPAYLAYLNSLSVQPFFRFPRRLQLSFTIEW